MEIGADYIATGHYARIEQLPNGRYAIRQSVTAAQGSDVRPVQSDTGAADPAQRCRSEPMRRAQVRAIAEAAWGSTWRTSRTAWRSAFVPDQDYARFIEENSGKKSAGGQFRDGGRQGRRAPSAGITHYTVGQRKGLNLSMGTVRYSCWRSGRRRMRSSSGTGSEVYADRLIC